MYRFQTRQAKEKEHVVTYKECTKSIRAVLNLVNEF